MNGNEANDHVRIISIGWTTKIELAVALVVNRGHVQCASLTVGVTEAIMDGKSYHSSLTEATSGTVNNSADAAHIEDARAKDEHKIEEGLKDHDGAVDSPHTGPVGASLVARCVITAVRKDLRVDQANLKLITQRHRERREVA